jgi:hypothetical protein
MKIIEGMWVKKRSNNKIGIIIFIPNPCRVLIAFTDGTTATPTKTTLTSSYTETECPPYEA